MRTVQIICMSLLIMFFLQSCDSIPFTEEKLPSFEEIGRRHNSAVSEAFYILNKQYRKTIKNDQNIFNIKQIEETVWKTLTIHQTPGLPHSLKQFRESLQTLKSYLYDHITSGEAISKNDSMLIYEMSIDMLYTAGILSDRQFHFIQEINAVVWADSLTAVTTIRRIEEQAYAELKAEAHVVLIYSAVLRHSLSYWKHEGRRWLNMLSSTIGKARVMGDIDWEQVAKEDAAGAVVGAIAGAIAGAKAAAGASLMFGPGGGVMLFSASLIKGIVAGAAAASLHAAIVSAL